MNQVMVAFWWFVAFVLVMRWLKAMKTKSTRRGRIFHNRIEWE